MIIHVSERPDDWHASLNGDPTRWGAGPTIETAVRDCVRTHARVFLGCPVTILLRPSQASARLPALEEMRARLELHEALPGLWYRPGGWLALWQDKDGIWWVGPTTAPRKVGSVEAGVETLYRELVIPNSPPEKPHDLALWLHSRIRTGRCEVESREAANRNNLRKSPVKSMDLYQIGPLEMDLLLHLDRGDLSVTYNRAQILHIFNEDGSVLWSPPPESFPVPGAE